MAERLSRADKFGGLKEVEFEICGYFTGAPHVRLFKTESNECGYDLGLEIIDPGLHFMPVEKVSNRENPWADEIDKPLQNIDQLMNIQREIAGLKIDKWKRFYRHDGQLIMDGMTWKLTLRFEEGRTIIREGDNCYPDNWKEFLVSLGHYTSLFDFLLEFEEEDEEE